MRYTAYLNEIMFFDSNSTEDQFNLVAGKLSLEQGTAGAAVFRIAPGNLVYSNAFTINDKVRVFRDNVLLYSGRVISAKQIMNTVKEIKCEGLLAILNDSIFYPAIYNCQLVELVTAIINSHNAQVDSSKHLDVGIIDAYEGYLYRAYENYESSWKRLSDLNKTFGGFLSVRDTADGLTLDFTADEQPRASQSIDFGMNLLDITEEADMTRLVTVLLPLGAETDNGDGTKTRLTITEVNDGSDVLESENITTYGRIYGVQVWDDVTVNSNLKTKGTEYLNANDHPAIAINVTALDLAQIDPTIEWFNLGDRIQVSSARHGIDGLFVLRKQDIDLINPSNNKFKLGEMTGGLISHNSNTQSQITADIERITSDYVTNEQMTDAISETETTLSSAIEQTAASITSTVEQIITDPDGVVSNLQTQITQNAEAVEIWINDFEKHITFDDNGITIRADDSEVYSQQDEDSYGFYDAGGNELLVIEPEGLKATTVETKAQFILSSGDYKEWAIRKGAVVNSKHNLNFVWIGG